MSKRSIDGDTFPRMNEALLVPVTSYREMTAWLFCWLYAASCIDMREMAMMASGEHAISRGYFPHLRKCVEEARPPSDDDIMRVFTKPREKLGPNPTLEEMQYYWRVDHRDPSQESPVISAVTEYAVTKGDPTRPPGFFWMTWHIDPVTGMAITGVPAFNMHRWNLKPGHLVNLHRGNIAETFGRAPKLA